MAERGRFFRGLVAWSAIAATVLSACGEPEAFNGTVLTSGDHAPDFELTNQFGRGVTLTQYLGSPVLLTFLYTNCPDVCPITAGQLRDALDSLEEDAKDIRVAAISLDPERDTVKAALEFSDRWEMTDGWDFLVGERKALEPLWKAYYLEPRCPRGHRVGECQVQTQLRRRTRITPAGLCGPVPRHTLQSCLPAGRRRRHARGAHIPAGPG